MKAWLPVFILSLLICACEKEIDVKLDNTPPKLVVEATIENGESPVVVLSKSIGFFSTISLQQLSASLVRDAEVFISNGTLTHKLKGYPVPVPGGLELFYYSIDSSNLATAFRGELSKAYRLRIVAEGKEYTAQTTIPDTTRRIDSLWWRPAPGSDTSAAVVMVRATDRPGYGDYIRYYTRTNRGPFLPPLNSAFDDFFIDGTTYELQLIPGVDRNFASGNRPLFFTKGDTVTLKLSNIDKATYDFWRTMEFSYASIGNPFSTPTTIKSNISGGALGYFGGYATQYRTLILR